MSKTSLPWLILAQLIVTLALVGYAYAVRDAEISYVVIGAVIAYWLQESTHLGRQVSDQRVANIIGGGEGGATVVRRDASAPQTEG